jgi:hypothetical protein
MKRKMELLSLSPEQSEENKIEKAVRKAIVKFMIVWKLRKRMKLKKTCFRRKSRAWSLRNSKANTSSKNFL